MFGWFHFAAENVRLRRALKQVLDDSDAVLANAFEAWEQVAELKEDHKGPYCMWDWISPQRLGAPLKSLPGYK